MADTIISPERFNSFIGKGGEPTQRSAEFMEATTRQTNFSMILTGDGSPEGVVVASPTRFYMDKLGGAGTVLYIKQSGNGNTGWLAT